MTFYSDKLPVGTRVTWQREVYRMPYAKRPWDTGVVVKNEGDGFVTVTRDGTDQEVTGPGVVFSKVQA